jgi:biopolymer transport protein ExbD
MQEFDPEEDSITGINVTPLVDITLVLLIIFMVTSRFITEPSMGVKLPKTSSHSSSQPSDRNVFLTMDGRHNIFLNNSAITQEELAGRVATLLKERPDMNLILRADKSIPHGDVIALLDIVRNAGVTQFGIAVENPEQ